MGEAASKADRGAGTKRTSPAEPTMSVIGGKADSVRSWADVAF